MCGENLFEMKYELTSLASYAQPRITTFCFFHILSILFFLLDNHSFFSRTWMGIAHHFFKREKEEQ